MNRELYTKNYFSFKGRANRAEYIILFIVHSILFILGERLPTWLSSFMFSNVYILIMQYILGCLFIIASFVGNVLATTRRLHDLNISGWWQLITIALYIIELPNYISILIIIPLIFCKGAEGVNKYGQQSTLFLFFKINRIIDRIISPKTWMGVERKADGTMIYRNRGLLSLIYKQNEHYNISALTYLILVFVSFIEFILVISLVAYFRGNFSFSILTLILLVIAASAFDLVLGIAKNLICKCKGKKL